jgi:hypothetical protein
MEDFEYSKMMRFDDIRQSKAWGNYLSQLGWKIYFTSNEVLIAVRKLGFTSVIKIQRPRSLVKKDLEEIDEIVKKEKPMFIKMEAFFDQDLSIFKPAGYLASENPLSVPSTLYIDLTHPEEKLWKDVSHSAKYSIHRAERENTKIEFISNPTDAQLTEFYKMHLQTARRKSFYTISYKEVEARVRSFGDYSYLALAYNSSGNLVSERLYLAYKDMVLYSLGGTAEDMHKEKGGYLLVWKSFLYLKNLGYKILDQEGVMDKRFVSFTKRWKGFSDFKEKFGGEIIKFPAPFIKYPNPWMHTVAQVLPGAF